MADVRALRGLRFTPAAGHIGTIAAPPYDVIGDEQRQRLAARNSRNIVHLILPQGGDERYRLAAERLEGWIREGYVAQEREAAFYLYRQTFKGPDGRSLMRTGFIGLVRLEGAEGMVRHHERTLERPLEDRLRLIRATRTQLSPVFLLYSDPEGAALRVIEARTTGERPGPRYVGGAVYGRRQSELAPGVALEFNDDDGVRHWFLPISDENATAEVRSRLAETPMVIADGHHRFSAALEYAERMRRAFPGDDADLPENFMLACFIRAEDPGLQVLPTHRVIPAGGDPIDPAAFLRKLDDRFDVQSFDIPASTHTSDTPEPLRPDPGRRVVIGARFAGDPRLHTLLLRPGTGTFHNYDLEPPLRSLDVAILHRLILEPEFGIDEEALRRGGRLIYERDPARAATAVASSEAKAAFFLRPLPPQAIFDVTAHGLVLPQKSTYFAPKLASGLVMHKMGI